MTPGPDEPSASVVEQASVVEPASVVELVETPFLRVVKGEPTPEELAALVAVLTSLAAPPSQPPARRPEWNAPRRLHRVVHPHGPGGWRASGLPR